MENRGGWNRGIKTGPREQTKRILELRQYGMKQKEIANTLGCCLDTVKAACRKYGMSVEQKPLTEDDAALVISKAGYDYVSGFFNSHSKVVIRCRDCGLPFEKMYRHLNEKANGTYQNKMTCPHCWRKEIEEERRKRREPKEREAQMKAQRKAEQLSRKVSDQLIKRLATHVCKNCGKEFCVELSDYHSEIYCSEQCQKRHHDRIKRDKRVRRMKAREMDQDITLEKLFNRDSGICYLCGSECDWNDWQTVDGQFVAGESYPSVDHVKPISKGGTHTWNNIKLACRRCNTIKGWH